MYDVSIIIPIYKVEPFIERCAVSLFSQDHQSIEFIFVNDCTPDKSIEVLTRVVDRFPERKPHVKLLHNEVNVGLSKTRERGFEIAQGQYILCVDSDDWIATDMVSSLLTASDQRAADVVMCDYYVNYATKQVSKKIANRRFKQRDEFIQAILSGQIEGFLCLKMFKRHLLQKLETPDFSLYEDIYNSLQLFYFAHNIVYLEKPLYHYNQANDSSITSQRLSPKNKVDLIAFNQHMIRFMEEHDLLMTHKGHYYGLILYGVLVNSDNFKQDINDICPEANHLRYLSSLKKVKGLRKLVLVIKFYGFDGVYDTLRRLYRSMRS